jgi:hypothetical protein
MATKILVGRQYWQFENANGKWPWRWKHLNKANCSDLCIWLLEYWQQHSLRSDNVFGKTNLLQRVCLVIHCMECDDQGHGKAWNATNICKLQWVLWWKREIENRNSTNNPKPRQTTWT